MGEGTSALLRIKLAWQGHWDVGRSCAGLAWDGGGAEQDSWTGWVWMVASLWPVNGTIIKLWVGFWSHSCWLRTKAPGIVAQVRSRGKGRGNPEPAIGLGSQPPAGQRTLQAPLADTS